MLVLLVDLAAHGACEAIEPLSRTVQKIQIVVDFFL
jgi:hypothetical protein